MSLQPTDDIYIALSPKEDIDEQLIPYLLRDIKELVTAYGYKLEYSANRQQITTILNGVETITQQNLPNSLPEKTKAHALFEKWMFVHELQKLLAQFRPDDWVTPNMVSNLNVNREGVKGFWTLNFATNEINDYTEEENSNDQGA